MKLQRRHVVGGAVALAAAGTGAWWSNRRHQPQPVASDAELAFWEAAFDGPNGALKGYLSRPKAGGRRGSVLVIHENRGLNPHIRDVARRVALAGYNALALDFLSPLGGTPADEDAARALFAKLDRADAAENGLAALAFLKSLPASNGRLGTVGFCWGGAMVNQLAVFAPDLDAAVCFYGMAPELLLVPQIKARLQLHYAGVDERINAGREAFESAMKAAGVRYQSYLYEGRQHAFHNDTNAGRYDEASARLAWSRTLALFAETLAD